MTKMTILRRSPWISVLIFIFGLSVILALIALWQFNLGDYKLQLARHLQQVLNKPVKLGDAELSFHKGVTFDFRNLQIGDTDDFSLRVPQLSITLKPLGLLHGKIIIEQILLESPSLKLGLPLKLARTKLDLDRLDLETIKIRQGNLTIAPPEGQGNAWHVERLNLSLHRFAQGLVSQLTTTAMLSRHKQSIQLQASLELTQQQPRQPWRQSLLRGQVSLKNLPRTLLTKWDIAALPQRCDLDVTIVGKPASSVRLTASLNDSRDSRSIVKLSSNWQSTGAYDSFGALKLGLGGIPLNGYLRLDHLRKGSHLSGQILLSKTKIKTLLEGTSPPLANLSGEVKSLKILFNGPLHATAKNSFSPVQGASLQLNNLSFPLGATHLSNMGMLLTMRDSRLRLSKGQGTLAHIPFRFSGASDALNLNKAQITFALHSTADLDKLQKEFQIPFLKQRHFTGKVPLELMLNGPLSKLNARLKIDLSATNLVIGKLLNKKRGSPLNFRLSGRLEPNRLFFDKARITLAQQNIQIAGNLVHKQGQWTGNLQLAPLLLAPLQSVSPLFSGLKITGEASGELTINNLNSWTGRLRLKNSGAHLTRVLSELNQAEGVLHFDRNGVHTANLRARLGKSRIHISGGLSNWQNALISLHVTGKELRARDLIFNNRQMLLQNLDGQLLINAGGITFDPVYVTVAKKTAVKVEGQMRGYHAPHTFLEVSSEDADILDVIRLFSGPRRKLPPHEAQSDASLELKAKVKKGTLGGVYFENAVGTINEHNGLFTLFPLNFSLGKGRVSGRVELEKERNDLLKISGRAQNCDADRIYTMLFEKSGIFRGTLDGNFYLEGEGMGPHFWKTAQGGGHIEIKKGAMRKLKSFAQIFSLLNVSQLFKFQLPDMDKEGLPFSLLESSARMTNGRLFFNDFQITSPAINISAVGQINTLKNTIDCTLGIKPLRTVDIILSRVPLFGWILTGKEEALITALFALKGPLKNPEVAATPVSSVAETALGIIGRTLNLPFRLLQKTKKLFTTPPRPTKKRPISKEKAQGQSPAAEDEGF